jgi:hypothetical protein
MHSGVIDKPTPVTLGDSASFLFATNIRIPSYWGTRLQEMWSKSFAPLGKLVQQITIFTV